MNTDVSSDCILWPAGKDRDGYGRVRVHGRMVFAHRAAMERHLGRQLERSEVVMHLCHQPACVNVKHLRVGTVAENNAAARARRPTLAQTVLGIAVSP